MSANRQQPEEVVVVYIAFGIGALLGFLAGVAICVVVAGVS